MTSSTARYCVRLVLVATTLLMFWGISTRAQNFNQSQPTVTVFSAYAQNHELVAKYRPPCALGALPESPSTMPLRPAWSWFSWAIYKAMI